MPEELHSDNPLAIIGEEDIVSGFKGLGFKPYAIKEPREFKIALDEVMSQKPAICLVQDNIYQEQEAQIKSYKNLALPVFIPFAKDGSTDLLNNIIKNIRLRAIGAF